MTYDRVLFLDVDGVINCRTTPQRHGSFIGIDPHMVLLVHRILEATDAKVVISSTWRNEPESLKLVIEAMKPFEVIGSTPNLRNITNRGEEVNAWLDEHKDLGIKQYAILDDNNWFHPNQPFFKTTWEHGLTQEVVDDVIEHFKPKETK